MNEKIQQFEQALAPSLPTLQEDVQSEITTAIETAKFFATLGNTTRVETELQIVQRITQENGLVLEFEDTSSSE